MLSSAEYILDKESWKLIKVKSHISKSARLKGMGANAG
jgi:hypothetical protein